MDLSVNRKRKRDIEESEQDFDSSFKVFSCGLGMKRRRRSLPPAHVLTQESMTLYPRDTACDDKTTAVNKSNLRRTLRRRVSMSVLRKKMKTSQDYSLPVQDNYDYLRTLSSRLSPCYGLKSVLRDHELQQKIDHEIKMREGTAKLLAASKHPTQLMEAAKNLLTSNTRIISYMTELQRRKTAEVMGKSITEEGSQVPCKANVSMSDIRIPLMWKDTDHFKNKGDYRRYAVFCLVKLGTDIYDTSMIGSVDRSMTDLTFDDTIVFNNVPHDFECTLEVYCHKLHEDLTIASTPKKIKKKINDLSESVGRSVGKRLSGLHDSDIMGNMVLGPKFELVAKGSLRLEDIDDTVRTYDFTLETAADGSTCELPLFGHYCCRLAALPHCLVQPAVTGYLNLQEDDDLSKWKRYWCVLKNLQLSCWLTPSDTEVTQPLITIPVNKNTQISDADPRTCKRSHTFHVKTVSSRCVSETMLAADSKAELNMWWDGLQQHLVDQALWKQACENVMDLGAPTKRRNPVIMRKGSLYEDTPIDNPSEKENRISKDLRMNDDQLSKMLNTLMGEAKQIRGDNSESSS